MRITLLLAAASAAITAPVAAQTSSTSTRDRITEVLGNLLGIGNSSDSSLDGQWRAGRTPLAAQRIDFDARVDSDVRQNKMTSATGVKLKSDYAALVELEASYASDRIFSTAERADLSSRYDAVLKVLADGRYADGVVSDRATVSEGQADFKRRVDAQVAARKITRTSGTRLKTDYTALVRLEADYLRDGVLSESERDDLDARLDALDLRVGDVAYVAPITARSRLDAIAAALPSSGLSATARAQLQVEHGDLLRLESAYARITPTSEERAYLERRIADLETRARVRR